MGRRLQVWPYHALAIVSGVIGVTLLYVNLGPGVPTEEELEKISGTTDKVILMDDLSGESTTTIDWSNRLPRTGLRSLSPSAGSASRKSSSAAGVPTFEWASG